MQGQSDGTGQHSTFQCFYCFETGHFKRNCPVLKAEQDQRSPSPNNRYPRRVPEVLYTRQPQMNPNDIDLN